MEAEIVTIGTELLLGDIVDTNSSFIARNLRELGIDIYYLNSVGDNLKRLKEVLKRALDRSDLIITTGGLGPTGDDLTREAISAVTGKRLVEDKSLMKDIENYFHIQRREMAINNRKQACLPEGSRPIRNKVGTAPGIILEIKGTRIISLPGVPYEMKKMFIENVKPYLAGSTEKKIKSRFLHFTGIGESSLEEKIGELLRSQNNPTLALLAGKGEVKLRITAKAKTEEEASKLIKVAENKIKARVGNFIYGVDNQTLPEVIGQLLKKKRLTLAVAESCTGGLLGNRITDVSGSSEYFMGGILAYSNDLKKQELGVKEKTLRQHGAVSRETAREMATGVINKIGTDVGVAITGIAGPGGGTPEKPVGLVYIGLAGELLEGKVKTFRLQLKGDRKKNKWLSSQYALHYLYMFLR